MQINRRQFLGASTLSLAGVNLSHRKASANEPKKPVSKSSQQPNPKNSTSISRDPMTPIYIVGAAFGAVATLVIPCMIQNNIANRKINEAFKRAEDADKRRARLH